MKTPLDPAALAASIKLNIVALEAEAGTLSPLLGFALTNLRGALSAVEGHVKNSAPAAGAADAPAARE